MFIIQKYDIKRLPDAKILQEKFLQYGYEMSLTEIIDFWSWVSGEHYCAGWLVVNDDELIKQIVEEYEYIEDWISEKRVPVIEYK